MVNPLDVAPQYASIILGISNTISVSIFQQPDCQRPN